MIRKRMYRRDVLAMVPALGLSALAGCTDLRDDEESPEDAVRAFYRAIDDQDPEAANAVLHPESPIDELDAGEFDDVDEFSIDLEDVTLEEQDDEMAVVSFTVTTDVPDEDETVTDEGKWELREVDGEWLLLEPVVDEVSAPAASIDIDASNATVTLVHVAGDFLDPDRVRVSVGETVVFEGGTTQNVADADNGWDDTIQAGQRLEVEVDQDLVGESISVTWLSEDGDEIATLAEQRWS